jgi:hypothetical protein
LYVGVSTGGQNLTRAYSKISNGKKEFRLPTFQEMNLSLRANDHSLQQKKNASKFLKAELEKDTFKRGVKKFIDC